MILTAVKETKTQKTKYVKQKNLWNKKLPDISVCKTNLLHGLQKKNESEVYLFIDLFYCNFYNL